MMMMMIMMMMMMMIMMMMMTIPDLVVISGLAITVYKLRAIVTSDQLIMM